MLIVAFRSFEEEPKIIKRRFFAQFQDTFISGDTTFWRTLRSN
jgi:hypothetical protein